MSEGDKYSKSRSEPDFCDEDGEEELRILGAGSTIWVHFLFPTWTPVQERRPRAENKPLRPTG